MQNVLTLSGLAATLVGACLLFVYSLPKKKWENVLVFGELTITTDDKGARNVPKEEWLPKATAFQRRARVLNSVGFALVAIGTLLQMVAVLGSA